MEFLIILYLAVVLSHGVALIPLFRALNRREMPRVVDFAILSVVLYYDVGLTTELFGIENMFRFPTVNQATDATAIFAALLLILVPWMLRIGAGWTQDASAAVPLDPHSELHPGRRSLFYLLATIVGLALAVAGWQRIASGIPIWMVRRDVGASFGPLVIILYLPLHFLAFYVRQRESRSGRGLMFSVFLTACTVMSTITIGQRTLLLLPVVILGLFWTRLSMTKMLVFGAAGLTGAGLLLPLLTWQYASSGAGVGELILRVIHGDVARLGILLTAIDWSEWMGTRMMPYPFAGYVYALLFYVPRAIAPFKGTSTAHYFTSYVTETPLESTGWVLGVGFMEEIIANGGLLFLLPGLFLYGAALGKMDVVSQRVPSLAVPFRLAAIWLCGYAITALLLTFGIMSLACWAFDRVFARPAEWSRDDALAPLEPPLIGPAAPFPAPAALPPARRFGGRA